MLTAADYTQAEAGNQLWKLAQRDVKDLTAAQWYGRVTRFLNRVTGKAQTLNEALHDIAVSYIQAIICKRGKKYLDTRDVSTPEEFLDALADF